MQINDERNVHAYITKRTCISLIFSVSFFTLIIGKSHGDLYAEYRENNIHAIFAQVFCWASTCLIGIIRYGNCSNPNTWHWSNNFKHCANRLRWPLTTSPKQSHRTHSPNTIKYCGMKLLRARIRPSIRRTTRNWTHSLRNWSTTNCTLRTAVWRGWAIC